MRAQKYRIHIYKYRYARIEIFAKVFSERFIQIYLVHVVYFVRKEDRLLSLQEIPVKIVILSSCERCLNKTYIYTHTTKIHQFMKKPDSKEQRAAV